MIKKIPSGYTGIVQRPPGREWYVEGLLYRLEGPAIEWCCGSKSWYSKGKFHRLGGLPAYEGIKGNKEWWVDGKLHRTDGPAMELVEGSGSKSWYFKGKQHRLDGPTYVVGYYYYYYNLWKILSITPKSSILLLL